MNIIAEIAVYTAESAIRASKAGARRIELCSGFSEGGLSPSHGTIQTVRKNITCRLHVMIRPRVGDFIYSDVEKEIILSDIKFCKDTGAEGIVFGALLNEGRIDKEFTKVVVKAAHPLSVTFHRAFDLCKDMNEALADLIDRGVSRVLTSGGEKNAIAGAIQIGALVEQSGDAIIILPGGGLNPDNIVNFVKQTGVKEIHLSAKKLKHSQTWVKPDISLISDGIVSDYCWLEADEEIVKQVMQLLKNI